jgi:hypothetical protein
MGFLQRRYEDKGHMPCENQTELNFALPFVKQPLFITTTKIAYHFRLTNESFSCSWSSSINFTLQFLSANATSL